jgi:hypothetical protein
MSPSSSYLGNSGDLVPGDGSTDVMSVLDHTSHATPFTRRRIGAASAALALLTTVGLLLDQSGSARAATAIGLGTADGFAVLAGSGITNTGTTTVSGDIGSFPTPTVTGDDAGQANDIRLTGTHRDDTESAAAKGGLLTAYNNAAGQQSAQAVTADLANPAATLTPGVYTADTSMGLTGTLTLDGGGNADAVFVFQAGTTLTTASASKVQLIGGAQACNVFWQVGSSATLGTDTAFVGTILAKTSITLNARASVVGRVLASNGAVTLDNNLIARPTCGTSSGTPTPTPTASGPSAGTSAPDAGISSTTGTPSTTPGAGTGTTGRNGTQPGTVRQVPRIPVGSVDAGDGSTASTPAIRE